jgi:hypothetical protein
LSSVSRDRSAADRRTPLRAPGITLLAGAALLAAGSAARVQAQVIDRPPRAFRGLFNDVLPIDPARTHQAITLRASMLGGYDQNVSPPGADPTQIGLMSEGASTSFADAMLRFWRGGPTRSLGVDARGYATIYGGGLVDPSFGSDLRLSGTTALGRQDQLSAAQDLKLEPFLMLGGFGALRSSLGADALPASSPVQGLSSTRSVAGDSSVMLNHRWSVRTSSSVDYEFNRRHYLDSGGFDSHSHAIRTTSSHLLSRRLSVRGSYRFSTAEYADPLGTRPLDDHNVEAGFSYDRPLSSTRRWSLGGSAGATRVSTIDALTRGQIHYWAPAASGTVHLDVGRSWIMSADYRRGATVLETASRESFFTDAFSVRAGGLAGERTDLTLMGAYTNGRQSAGQGHYGSYLATGQVRIALARCCAVVANYSRFFYRLERLELTEDFPDHFSRNAIRAGFDLSLPLKGLPRTNRPRPAGE